MEACAPAGAPAAAAAPPPARASPAASFSAVSYGELGQLLAHCLSLPDLAAWNRVHRDGKAVVARKMQQFKCINLGDYPNMQPPAFEQMCDRVCGLEVVLLPYQHPCLLRQVESVRGEARWQTPQVSIMALLRLLDRSASSLLCVAFDASSVWPLGHEYDGELRRLLGVLAARVARWPRLQWMDMPRCLPAEEGEALMITCMLRRQAVQGRTELAEANSGASVRSTKGRAGGACSNAVDSAPAPAGWPLVASGAPLLLLAVSFPLLAGPRLAEACPELEILRWDVDPPADAEKAGFISCPPTWLDREAQVMRESGQPLLFHPSTLARCLQPFSQLLQLSLWLSADVFERYSVLQLHLPLLLQLSLSDCGAPCGLGDLDLHCPRLLVFASGMVWVASALSPDGQEAELSQPPSLLTSLARSPHLRAIDLEMWQVADVRPQLTMQQRAQMNATAAALNLPSVFEKPRSYARMLLYALSTLPCASALEALADDELFLSLVELYSLFPALRSLHVPPCSLRTPHWQSPSPEDDLLHRDHVSLRRRQPMLRSWHPLRSRELENAAAFAPRCCLEPAAMPATLSLAHESVSLEFSASLGLLHSGHRPFRQLSIVYLAAPTRVDPHAVQLLLVHCLQLRCLSLIQLRGVSDALFSSLPVRPALEVLRLKGACEQVHQHAASRLSYDICPTLARQFPRLRHLELLQRAPALRNRAFKPLIRVLSQEQILPAQHEGDAPAAAAHERMSHAATPAVPLPAVIHPSAHLPLMAASAPRSESHGRLHWPLLHTLVLNRPADLVRCQVLADRILGALALRHAHAHATSLSPAAHCLLVYVSLHWEHALPSGDEEWRTHGRRIVTQQQQQQQQQRMDALPCCSRVQHATEFSCISGSCNLLQHRD